ncbi:MAG: hypothetical protein RLY86_2659 [Pseudomonadota bacterium]|jgi:tetratricopeptide (TPR) repeat protein
MRRLNLLPLFSPTGRALAALSVVLTLTTLPAQAALFRDREACLAKAEEAPDFARANAKVWESQGGGADARLCAAMAALIAGDWAAAAPALEASARELAGEGPALQANLLTRAAIAWREAEAYDKAEAAHGRAIALSPADSQLLLDRAATRAAAESWWDAVADLDKAVEMAPKNGEARLQRAEAQAMLGRRFEAVQDLNAVLAADPGQAQALLLRGRLRADGADYTGARADWLALLQAAPDSSAAAEARRNLEALEAFARQSAQQ